MYLSLPHGPHAILDICHHVWVLLNQRNAFFEPLTPVRSLELGARSEEVSLILI